MDSFNKWYEDRSKEPWNFKEELIKYCKDDVKILALIVKIFHEICVTKFEISPWFHVTAPSYVHKVVIQKIIKDLELPEDPGERSQYLANKDEVWSVLRPAEYWFVRNALRGGRTDVRKLYHELSEEDKARGCKIKYVDVVSMYPAVQVKYDYPCGSPTIHVYDERYYPCFTHQNPECGNVHKTCDCTIEEKRACRDKLLDIVEHGVQPTPQELLNYFGFICISMIPNKELYHPVLVSWDDTQNKCVASLENIEEGYFTTEEVKVAIELGYQVVKVHRIDQYIKAPGLWNDFIKELYIEKLANSGPAPDDDEKIRLVDSYEDAYEMGDAVQQSFNRWKFDGALRTVYKTLLNCGWGKHCQRPNMDKHVTLHLDEDADTIFDDIQNGLFNASNTELLPSGYMNITLKNTGATVLNTHNTYIPAGCYVPAYGRLTLFYQMHKLGDRVLYHDTDSIIYIYDPAMYNIPESDIWGAWDEEKISKKGIDKFVSLGPKSYAVQAGSETILKLKGLAVKNSHRNMVNFDVLHDLILQHVQNQYPVLKIPQFRFKYKQARGMITDMFLKALKFTPSTLKGDLHESLKIYPFGFREELKM